jgi:hypothetical protein
MKLSIGNFNKYDVHDSVQDDLHDNVRVGLEEGSADDKHDDDKHHNVQASHVVQVSQEFPRVSKKVTKMVSRRVSKSFQEFPRVSKGFQGFPRSFPRWFLVGSEKTTAGSTCRHTRLSAAVTPQPATSYTD